MIVYLPTRQVAEILGEAGSISIRVPFTPGDNEVEVVLSLEGQTIHQQIVHVDQNRLELKSQILYLPGNSFLELFRV